MVSRSEEPNFRHRDVPMAQASEWPGPKVGMKGAAQGSAQSTGTAERDHYAHCSKHWQQLMQLGGRSGAAVSGRCGGGGAGGGGGVR